jgi:hypothetical protein
MEAINARDPFNAGHGNTTDAWELVLSDFKNIVGHSVGLVTLKKWITYHIAAHNSPGQEGKNGQLSGQNDIADDTEFQKAVADVNNLMEEYKEYKAAGVQAKARMDQTREAGKNLTEASLNKLTERLNATFAGRDEEEEEEGRRART